MGFQTLEKFGPVFPMFGKFCVVLRFLRADSSNVRKAVYLEGRALSRPVPTERNPPERQKVERDRRARSEPARRSGSTFRKACAERPLHLRFLLDIAVYKGGGRLYIVALNYRHSEKEES
jgi:hypothetical protein